MMRTFIAIDIPTDIKTEIVNFQAKMARERFPLRWVNPKNIHITLKFIGEIPQSLVEQIKTDIFERPLPGEPFQVSIEGTGVFPNLRKPRVFWIGITAGHEHILKLVQYIEDQLTNMGILKEKRPFQPHITIGRFKQPYRNKNMNNSIGSGVLTAGSFTVEKIIFMKSVLKPSGAEYTELAVQTISAH